MTDKLVYVNGSVVGKVEKGVYTTKRNSKIHLFRKFNGWGISEEILARPDITAIKIVSDKGTYTADKSAFSGVNARKYNHNGDAQVILPLYLWKHSKTIK